KADAREDGNGGSAVTVTGGLLLERQGWYRIAIEPACSAVTASVDQQPINSDPRPMLVGVHAFEITLPRPNACALPLRILLRSESGDEVFQVSAGRILSSTVATLPHGKARQVAPYAGFGPAEVLTTLPGIPLDFGMDGQGRISVLLRDRETIRVQRLDLEGHDKGSWQPQGPGEREIGYMAVDHTGTIFL